MEASLDLYVDADAFRTALEAVCGVFRAGSNVAPVVAISADTSGKVELFTNNGAFAAKDHVSGRLEKPGFAVVSAQCLQGLVKAATGVLNLEATKAKLKVENQAATSTLALMKDSVVSYDPFEKTGTTNLTTTGDALQRALSFVSGAETDSATGRLAPSFRVYWRPECERTYLIATNGSILRWHIIEEGSIAEEGVDFAISPEMTGILKRFSDLHEITITPMPTFTVFSGADWKVVGATPEKNLVTGFELEATSPTYQSENEATVEGEDLTKALAYLKTIHVKPNETPMVVASFSDDEVVLESRSNTNQAKATITVPAEIKGSVKPGLKVGLSLGFLQDAAKLFAKGRVTIGFSNNPLDPIIVRDPPKSDALPVRLVVIMPMRLD